MSLASSARTTRFILCLIALSGHWNASALAQERAQPADAFVDSIGVNTHFGYQDTYYEPGRDYTRMKLWLNNLGVRHIRDGSDIHASSAKLWMQDTFRTLFQETGIRTTFCAGPNYGAVPQDIITMIQRVTPAALACVEGPNEPDNTYIGGMGNEAARQWMFGIYPLIKGHTNPAIASLPVAGPSPIYGYGPLAPLPAMDYQNMHPYPGAWPLSESIDSNMANADLAPGAGNPLKPYIATEVGYEINPVTSRPNGVSQRAAGIYVPRMYAELYKRGVTRTFYYQLVQQGGETFGLMQVTGWNANGTEATSWTYQPSYLALKNLIGLLRESTWNASTQSWSTPSFTPGTLDIQFKGASASIRHLLLQKSNGRFFLLVWNEVRSFDGNNKTEIYNAPEPVTLICRTPIASATVHTLNDAGAMASTAITPSGSPQTFSLNVPDKVMVLELVPTGANFGAPSLVEQEIWNNLSGTSVSAVPQQTAPSSTVLLSALEGTHRGDNYGTRIRGHIVPPVTGPYTFWIASDDNGEFRLSRSTSPSELQLIARVPEYTAERQWNKYAEQRSTQIYLQAGHPYYFEALAKEGGGGDHVAVAWRKPGSTAAAGIPDEVVPGSALRNIRLPAAASTSPPVAYFNCNEGGGTTAVGTNGLSIDLAGGASWVQGRTQSGNAIQFNGTSAYGQLSSNQPSVNFDGPITLSAWIRPASLNGTHYILSHSYTTRPHGEVVMGIFNGSYYVGSWDGTKQRGGAWCPAPSSDVNAWVHLTGVFEGGRWSIYRNGILAGSGPAWHGAIMLSRPWTVGATSVGSDRRFFQGAMDDIRIYDRPLQPAEIQQIHSLTDSGASGSALFNNTAPEINYAGTWGYSGNRGAGDYLDDVHYTAANGASATLSFQGTSIAYITEKAADMGQVEIFIDNVLQETVDCYHPTRLAQQVVFSRSGLSPTAHTIRIVKKSGAYMLLDAFRVSSPATYNNTDSRWSYSGSWGVSSGRGAGDYMDDVHYTPSNGASAEFTFQGTGVDYITEKAPDMGLVDVYVNYVYQATVDCYSPTRLSQQTLFSKTGLPAGTHTLTLVKVSGPYMLVDAARVFP